MIPVSLQLKNFLSYAENVAPLDFNEFNIACLSGKNGHGKSALLDAVTWVLWGEARKAAGEKSPADGLLRIGASEMRVELVFDLDGDRYRAIRKYQRKSRRTGLDFQIFDEASNGYKTLNEQTSRQTQKKINATLRMEYDTFINSAFILQGRVDEFTKKTPRKRKAILAEILDLSRYDQLVELAKDRHKEAKGREAQLSEQLTVIKQELEHKPEYIRQLNAVQRRIKEVDAHVQTDEAQRQTLERGQAELRAQHTQLREKTAHTQQLAQELTRLEKRQQRQEAQIAEVQAVLAREKEIVKAYERYLELQQRKEEYEQKFKQLSMYQSQKSVCEKNIEAARTTLEKELEHWRIKRAQEDRALEEIQPLLDRTAQIEQGFHELEEARRQDDEWEQARSRVDALQHEIRSVERVIQQHENDLLIEIKALERHAQELQALAEQHVLREQRIRDAHTAVLQLEACERQVEECRESGAECTASLEQLKQQQQQRRERLQELGEKLDLLQRSEQPQCPLCASKLEGDKKAELADRFQHDIQSVQDELKTLEQTIHAQTTRHETLRKESAKLQRALKKQGTAREQESLALAALEESRQAETLRQSQHEQLAALRQQRETQAYAETEFTQLAALQQRITELAYDPNAHRTLKKHLKTLRAFEREASKLEEAHKRREKSVAALPAIEAELTRLNARLEQRDYAREAQTQRQHLVAAINAVAYDEQAHLLVEQALRELEQAPSQKIELDQAQKSLAAFQLTLDELIAEYRQKSAQHCELTEQIEKLTVSLQRLPDVERQLKVLTAQLTTLKRERDELLQQRGVYETKYAHCQQLEVQAAEREEEHKQANKENELFGKLVHIFGKDGVQAFLIENAIPEIEEQANQILGRLTDNRTHIAIESVKDLQKGGSKETLDIKISDELGTRSYEMYSGGEAFRVDFAIRIALSKLLAKRAGTRLRTLVIDEGFGTQDTQGIEQLVEAIKAISADFEKILVITHLESLKDAFPVRIEVVKYPDIGSQYQIVH